MLIQRLKVENFASIGSVDLDLSTIGLNLVTGINVDKDRSNGSGKTSIFEALIWCLFGRITKSGAKISNEIVNRQINKPAKVLIEILKDGTLFEIERIRQAKGKSGKTIVNINQDGKIDLRGKDVAESNVAIVDIIGVGYEEFIRSYYFPQNSPKSFAEMNDKELKKYFLEDVLSCDWIEQCHKVVKDMAKEGEIKLSEAELRLKILEDRRIRKIELIEELQEKGNGWEKSKLSTLAKLKEELQFCYVNQDKVEEKRKKLNEELKELHDKSVTWDNEHEERLETKEKELKDLYDKQANEKKEDEEAATKKIELDRIDKELEGKEPFFEKYSIVKDRATELSERHKFKLWDVKTCDEELLNCESQLTSTKEYVDTSCEKCGTKIEEKHLPFIQREIHERTVSLKNRRADLILEGESLKQDFSSLVDQLREMKLKLDKFHNLEEEKKQLEISIAKFRGLTDIENSIKLRELEFSEMKQEKSPYSELLLKEVKRYVENSEGEKIEQEIERLNKELKWQKEEENPYQQMLEVALKDSASLDKDIGGENDCIENVNKELEIMQFWMKGFSSQGLQSYLLDSVTPVLNNMMSKVLGFLTDGEMTAQFSTVTKLKNGDYRDKFALEVKNVVGGDSYKLLSGGEAKRIDLATSMVMADLVRSGSSNVIDFLVFDEPFKSLDQDGIDKFLEYVSEEYSNIPVFVITHTDCDHSLFHNEIVVEKRNGISEVV